MKTLKEQLGRTMSVKEVAEYLKIDTKTVRKYYLQLGGVRFGKAYRFFERRINDAIQAQWEMASAGQVERPDDAQDIPDKKRSHTMGGRTTEKPRINIDRDPFNLAH